MSEEKLPSWRGFEAKRPIILGVILERTQRFTQHLALFATLAVPMTVIPGDGEPSSTYSQSSTPIPTLGTFRGVALTPIPTRIPLATLNPEIPPTTTPTPRPTLEPTAIISSPTTAVERNECRGRIASATHYADLFEGRTAASGETFHQNSNMAASLDHPFDTRLRVTRVDGNNRMTRSSVEARVVDRGRFNYGDIDLAKAAFVQIGTLDEGRIRVCIELVR
jgi:hypothetical protein